MTKKTLTLKCGFETRGKPHNGEIRITLLTGAAVGGWRPGKPGGETYPMLEILADFAAGHVPVKFDQNVLADWGQAGSIVSIWRETGGFYALVK